MIKDTYIEKNDWYITASKLKCFLKNPQEYYFKYVKKIDIGDNDKRCFVVWTAVDDLLSYGEKFFLGKHYIDDWYVVTELKTKITEKYWENINWIKIKDMKLPELRYHFYDLENERIRLTPKEWENVMGMYREIKRQPLADFWNENYVAQKVIECNYKSLKLRGTLDRFSAEDLLIRDWKTTGRFDSFEYDMDETFDYVMSMAFYFILAKIEYWVECDVILDVVHKNAPYQFVAYKLWKQQLLQKAVNKIKPWLEALIKAYETDTWEAIDPLTQIPLPRSAATKSEYYEHMESSVQKDFLSPI